MKIKVYGIIVNKQLLFQQLHLHKDTAQTAAHQINYDGRYKDNVQLVKCNLEYKKIKQISQDMFGGMPKLKKRKKKRRRLK